MIGVIGGSGFYQMVGLRCIEPREVMTPFGSPSAKIMVGVFGEKPVAFLPRHGEHHELLPSEINYRANIYALKYLGVREVVSVSAVGSLRDEIAPGDLATPDQYLDCTKSRASSFFGGGLGVHISTAEPSCRRLSDAMEVAVKADGVKLHRGLTYACVEGPRLGTRAESHFLRGVGADIVGMTNVPEAFLAREAQLCYVTLAIATDYDCWKEDPAQHASADQIFALYRANLDRIQKVIARILGAQTFSDCSCRHVLEGAVVTSGPDRWSREKKELLAFLKV